MAREKLSNAERQQVRAFVMRLFNASPYETWEQFIAAAGLNYETSRAWRYKATAPPIPEGLPLYRMLRAAEVLDDWYFTDTESVDAAEAMEAAKAATRRVLDGKAQPADEKPQRSQAARDKPA